MRDPGLTTNQFKRKLKEQVKEKNKLTKHTNERKKRTEKGMEEGKAKQ